MKRTLHLLFFVLYMFAFSANSQDFQIILGNDSDSTIISTSGHGMYYKYTDSVCHRKILPRGSSVRGMKIEKMECDYASFEILKYGYARDKNIIYYNGIKINDVDYKSFSILEIENPRLKSLGMRNIKYEYYAIDKDKVFYGEKVLTNADQATIESISSIYTKDTNHVFIGGDIIESADANSFVLVQGRFAKDQNHVYHVGKILSNNPESFEIVDYESRYAKDKEDVYFWWGFGGSLNIDTITEVNVENFRLLTDFRATDGENVYWFGYLMPEADVESLKVINLQYSSDHNHVYFKYKLISGANPETFEILEKNYSKDDKAVYYLELLVENADPVTFIPLGYQWGKDKEYIYFKNIKREDIDYKTFSIEN